MTAIAREYLDTPAGTVEVCADADNIISVEFVSRTKQAAPNTLTRKALKQLKDYFAGKRKTFELPLKQQGTDFQHQVWKALQSIPFGATCSYVDIAKKIKRPKAVRAVGAANGRNRIAIIIPCHRVIGADGSLTGYAGGLNRKKILLDLEGAAWRT